jgi:hypothetical protein
MSICKLNILAVTYFLIPLSILGQNLVQNPGFEQNKELAANKGLRVFIDEEKNQLKLYTLDSFEAVNDRRRKIGLGPIFKLE